MKAMIFAAGYGIRLKPLTDTMPKALVHVCGKPMLQHIIEKTIQAGIKDIVVNVHHFPGQVTQFLNAHDNFGVNIQISDEREELLDTGGGLLKASSLLEGSEPILLHNVDVISNLDINKLLDYHMKNDALATLVVRKRETQRYLMFSEKNILTGWKNIKTQEQKVSRISQFEQSTPYAFSGIHVVDPKLFKLISSQGKFSIIDTYLELAKKHKIMGYIDTSGLWVDIGKPGQIDIAEELLQG